MDTEKKNQHDTRTEGTTYEKIYMRQASCCTLASSLEYAVWPSKSEASLECMTWNMLRRCCSQRDPPVTWIVHIVPYSFVPFSKPKSHTHLLNGSKEVHATKRKSFWKAFRHLACRSLAPKKNKLYISTKKREIFWFFPWGKKNVVVLGRLDTLGVVVHDLRIRHTRRSSANLGHAVEGHVLLAV